MDGSVALLEEYRCACGMQVRFLGRMSDVARMQLCQHRAEDECPPLPPLLDGLEHHGDFRLSRADAGPYEQRVVRFRELARAAAPVNDSTLCLVAS